MALKKASMEAVVKQKKPTPIKCHHQDHLDFTICHKDRILEDCKKVMRSDKTKTNILGSDGHCYVWKYSSRVQSLWQIMKSSSPDGDAWTVWPSSAPPQPSY